MLVIAFISDPAVINKILQHLGLPSSPPPISPVKTPVEEQDFFNGDFPEETTSEHANVFPPFSHSTWAPP
jgi:hypothetical protein